MNRVIIACALFSIATAAVIPAEGEAQIVKYESTNDGAGNYKFSYETSNGITREETGHLVNAGREDEHIVVQGSYSYTDVDGKYIVVTYTADENGYRVNLPPSVPAKVELAFAPNVVASLLGK